MATQPPEFFALAVQLAARCDEVAGRSAISRAYYAAYHHPCARAAQ